MEELIGRKERCAVVEEDWEIRGMEGIELEGSSAN